MDRRNESFFDVLDGVIFYRPSELAGLRIKGQLVLVMDPLQGCTVVVVRRTLQGLEGIFEAAQPNVKESRTILRRCRVITYSKTEHIHESSACHEVI